MNFNASRNVGHGGNLRKAKRVSDVNALGGPPPAYNSAAGPTATPAPFPGQQVPPPNYQENINFDQSQSFNNQIPPAGNYGFNEGFPQSPIIPGMPNASQFGAMIQQPIVQDMAVQYGQQLAAQGRQLAAAQLQRYVPLSALRYYFAVDTRYVINKLLLIFFPFTHKDWLVKYVAEGGAGVQPRYDLNAPDLYIPAMGYVTYVLLAGFMLGVQQRFSPEQLGVQASGALAYIIFEMVLYLATLYVTATTTSLRTLDLLAFSGYKYTIMIAALLAGLFTNAGYYLVLLFTSCSLSYFLVKTLRVQVLSGATDTEPSPYGYGANPYVGGNPAVGGGGTKRRVYFLLFVAVMQPLLSWWLTYHLLPTGPGSKLPIDAPSS